MSSHPQVKIIRAEPQLFVTDLGRSLAFFNDQLGFRTEFSHGEPPFCAQISRGAAHLNLRLVPKLWLDPAQAVAETFLAATICVDEILPLYAEYEALEITFEQGLQTESWGATTFIISDPDGNLILFAG